VRRIQLAANKAWMSDRTNRLLHHLGLFAGVFVGIVLAIFFGPLPVGGVAGAVLSIAVVLLIWVVFFGLMIAITMKSRRAALYAQLRREGYSV
jgi:amino acid transporter